MRKEEETTTTTEAPPMPPAALLGNSPTNSHTAKTRALIFSSAGLTIKNGGAVSYLDEVKEEEEETEEEETRTPEELAEEYLTEDENALIWAANDCGYVLTFETYEEMYDQLQDIKDNHLLSDAYATFEEYMADQAEEYMACYDIDLHQGSLSNYLIFDYDQFNYDLGMETNYTEINGTCFVFDI